MRVLDYLRDRRSIFHQDTEKRLSINLPLDSRSSLSAILESDELAEPQRIVGELASTINTSRGTIGIKTGTDEPAAVDFRSSWMPSPVPVAVDAYANMAGSASVTGKVKHAFGWHALQQHVMVDYRKDTTDLNGALVCRIMHPRYSINFDTGTHEKTAIVDAFVLGESLRAGFNICMHWQNMKVRDMQTFVETVVSGSIVTLSAVLVPMTCEMSVERRFGRLTAAGWIDVRALGYGPVAPDFSCRLAGKFDFDSNTSVKCCLRSEGVVASTLALKVGDYSKMEFTGNVPIGSVRNGTFGASISFDFTKKKKE